MNRREIVKKIFEYLKRYKREFFIAIIFLIIFTSLQLLTPALLGYIIDNKLAEGVDLTEIKSIILLVGGYFLMGIIQSVFRYFSNLKFFGIANLLAIDIREDLYDHIQKLPMSFYDKTAVGKIVTRLTNDTDALKEFFKNAFSQLLTSLAFIVLTIVLLLIAAPWALIFIIVPMPIIYYLIKTYDKKSIGPLRKYRKSLSNINSDINENIEGMGVIRSFNVEDGVYEEFKDLNDKTKDLAMEYHRITVTLGGSNMTNVLQRLNTRIILGLFVYMNLQGNLYFSVGLMYILVDYTERIYQQVSRIMVRISDFERSIAATEQIFQIFAIEPEKSKDRAGVKLKGDVEFKNLPFYYVDEDYVLKDISFKANSGMSVALVGETGSGKSSIINLIFRLYKEQKGEILFDGINANDYSIYDLRDNMAIVLQDPFIFNDTLRNNISLGDEFTDEKIYESLISVGGENLYKNMEDGLDTIMAKGGSNLSQGEKQIITFARAIIRDPNILVLDEATSSIDTETETYIQIGLDKLKEGRTTFTIAHRLSTIKDSDLILVLKDGEIIERGDHDSLIDNKGQYYKMLEKEIREG